VAVGVAGEQALVPHVLVALAVAVELVEGVGDLPRDPVGQRSLPDEERRVEGRPGFPARDGRGGLNRRQGGTARGAGACARQTRTMPPTTSTTPAPAIQ
jgi:hypothetical protein